MGKWYCHYCDSLIEPRHVTYSEHHDSRSGGCGNRVSTKDDVDDKDAQIATLTAKLAECERENEALNIRLKSAIKARDIWTGNADIGAKAVELQSQNDELRAVVARLTKQLDGKTQSTSDSTRANSEDTNAS